MRPVQKCRRGALRLAGTPWLTRWLGDPRTGTENWTALPSGTPATVRRLLARCLERKTRNVGCVMVVTLASRIDEALASPGGAIAENTVGLHGRTTLGRATAVIASAAVGALVAWSLKPGASTPPATTGCSRAPRDYAVARGTAGHRSFIHRDLA
mgnify:CR=1 FL=1